MFEMKIQVGGDEMLLNITWPEKEMNLRELGGRLSDFQEQEKILLEMEEKSAGRAGSKWACLFMDHKDLMTMISEVRAEIERIGIEIRTLGAN